MKRIAFLSTGGTIASANKEPGGPLLPSLTANELLDYVPQVREVCDIESRDIMNMDSSNIQPEEWRFIAGEIFKTLPSCDGIVLTHGTDTLAYTAAMLSHMLADINKPVIITGAQLPISHIMSDGRRNLESAFAAAAEGVAGIYVLFDNKIIAGTRAIKLRTAGFDAFASINYPVCGTVDAKGIIFEHPLPVSGKEPRLLDEICPDVALVKIIPGTKPQLFDSIVDLGYKGVVIEAFGTGGMHFLNRNLPEKVRLLCDAGISVVIISQCLYDATDLGVYESGSLLPPGVISGGDMTAEAAVTRLMWALGQTDKPEEIRDYFK